MKWTIQELRKLSKTLNNFHNYCDCKKYLSEDDPDIHDISDVEVAGNFQVLGSEGLYIFNVEISCVLTMPCAITLEEVKVPLHFETSLEFSQTFIDDNTHVFEGITINLDPYIWAEILVEKPMRVVSQNAYESYSEDIVELEEDETSTNPFAGLKE